MSTHPPFLIFLLTSLEDGSLYIKAIYKSVTLLRGSYTIKCDRSEKGWCISSLVVFRFKSSTQNNRENLVLKIWRKHASITRKVTI